MKRSLLELYGLVVCFVSLAVLAIYVGCAAWEAIGVMAPSVTMDAFEFEQLQTDKAWRNHLEKEHHSEVEKGVAYQPPEGAELTAARERELAAQLNVEARKNRRSLIQDLIAALIGAMVFGVHWKVAARARQDAS